MHAGIPPPQGLGLETPPRSDSSTSSRVWAWRPARHAGIPAPPPVDRRTRVKTYPSQTSFAGGNKLADRSKKIHLVVPDCDSHESVSIVRRLLSILMILIRTFMGRKNTTHCAPKTVFHLPTSYYLENVFLQTFTC